MIIPPFLACPECHCPDLAWVEDLRAAAPPYDVTSGLRCPACRREFPHVDGVWVMWSDQARTVHLSAPSEEAPIAERVKWANVQIYDDISDEYGEHHDGTRPYAETQLFLKAIADDFQQRGEPGRNRVLVDVGCATGVSLDIGSNGYEHVVGVDISLQNLRAVVRRGHVAVLADADRLPFAPDSVDFFTCFATLHHFPDPPAFIESAFAALRPGGVLLIGCEPTRAAVRRGPLADLVWDLRKPVYRILARRSSRYHLHRNKAQQDLNDLAEYNRTNGGFDPGELGRWLSAAGFATQKIFYGTDPSAFRTYEMPNWKLFVLKALSFQNPLRRSNWVNVTAVGRKERDRHAARPNEQARIRDSAAA